MSTCFLCGHVSDYTDQFVMRDGFGRSQSACWKCFKGHGCPSYGGWEEGNPTAVTIAWLTLAGLKESIDGDWDGLCPKCKVACPPSNMYCCPKCGWDANV